MDGKQKRCSQILGLMVIAVGLVLAQKSAGPGAAVDRNLREKNTELDSIRIALQKGRSKLDSLKTKEGTSLAQLEQTESNIRIAREYLASLSHKVDESSSQLAKLEDSLFAAERQLSDRQSIMKRRLRNMYMASMGRPGEQDFQMVLTSESVADALRRIQYFRSLKEYDRILLTHIDSSKSAVSKRTLAVRAERDRLEELRATKVKEQTLLIAERASQEGLLKKIRLEKSTYAALVKQLEESQRKLRGIIEDLIKKQARAAKQTPSPPGGQAAFGKKKGNFPWPIRGTVVSNFGRIVHPVYKTTIMNNGIDIRPGDDRDVRSIAPGTVVYVGWMRGLGQFLMIDHADGFLSIYARLGTVAVKQDQKVATGTLVGSVSEGEDFHFEIRKATEPLDPREWLE